MNGAPTTQMQVEQDPASSQEGRDTAPPQAGGIGGPVWVAWREGTLTRAEELEALCKWVRKRAKDSPEKDRQHIDHVLAKAVQAHLDAARQAAHADPLNPKRRFVLVRRVFRNGPLIERAMSNLDAAEAQLLNIAPACYILGQVPCLLRHVQCHLPAADPARQEFERIARRLGINDPDHAARQEFEFEQIAQKLGIKDPDHPLPQNGKDQSLHYKENIVEEERGKIVTTVRAASSEALRERVRLRNFRNVVVATTILMTLLAIGVALTGFLSPTLIPLCFAPQESGQTVVVCPTGQSTPFPTTAGTNAQQPGTQVQDIDDATKATVSQGDLLVVELVGLTAAAVAAAAAIRRLKGSSERYGLPAALAALKLPTGAITAFLGLLLMRGQFVPGLSALDTSAQILAWALVFGYAQQLFTRLVDQQGQTVLNNVRQADNPQTSPSPA
jgi:hypothetical protein